MPPLNYSDQPTNPDLTNSLELGTQTTDLELINIFEQGNIDHTQENRALKITLYILISLIVVLIFTNIGVGIYQQTQAEIASEESPLEDKESFYSKIEELFSQDPVDIDEINRLYLERIQILIDMGEIDEASDLIADRTERFIAKNLKQEALDALLSTDFSIFDEWQRNRHYTRIILLAEELGDTETADKYKKLQAGDDPDAEEGPEEAPDASKEIIEYKVNTYPAPETTTYTYDDTGEEYDIEEYVDGEDEEYYVDDDIEEYDEWEDDEDWAEYDEDW